jgi:hypothetical protein
MSIVSIVSDTAKSGKTGHDDFETEVAARFWARSEFFPLFPGRPVHNSRIVAVRKVRVSGPTHTYAVQGAALCLSLPLAVVVGRFLITTLRFGSAAL